jgi:hypothetical protein
VVINTILHNLLTTRILRRDLALAVGLGLTLLAEPAIGTIAIGSNVWNALEKKKQLKSAIYCVQHAID